MKRYAGIGTVMLAGMGFTAQAKAEVAAPFFACAECNPCKECNVCLGEGTEQGTEQGPGSTLDTAEPLPEGTTMFYSLDPIESDKDFYEITGAPGDNAYLHLEDLTTYNLAIPYATVYRSELGTWVPVAMSKGQPDLVFELEGGTYVVEVSKNLDPHWSWGDGTSVSIQIYEFSCTIGP